MASYVEYTSFPRLERQGILFGLQKAQLVFCSVGVFMVFWSSMTSGGGSALKTMFFFSLPVMAFGMATYQRRPLVTYVYEWMIWMFRKMLGQNKWKVRPERLVEEQRFGLPGVANSRISAFTTAFAEGALLWDSYERTATAVIQCETSSFALASDSDRGGRIAGFSTMCAQVTANPGVERVAMHARTIPAATQAVGDYYRAKVAERGAGPQASQWAHNEYEAILDLMQERPDIVGAVSRDVLVAITISERGAEADIKSAGGGKEGMSYVMAREVQNLGRLLDGAGASNVRWLGAAEVARTIRTAFDPEFVTKGGLAKDMTEGAQISNGPVAVHEEFDMMRTDSAYHQTFWISEWPRTQVPAGFLADLIARGEYTHTVTQVFKPVPVEKALKDIRDARSGLDSKVALDNKLGRPQTAEQRAQIAELNTREEEIVQGYSDIQFTGYVTISAEDAKKLGEARAAMLRSAPHLSMRLLRGNQSAAFTAANLPVGWGLK